jgi:hypothetical protein
VSQYQSGLNRGGSLKGRHAGDNSPLDTIRKETKTAHRAHHLRKKNFQGADVIDRLDKTGVSRYHHEGPYDAASIARNRDKKYSPVAAVQESNEEALKATPRENIMDSLQRHRPLEGVAIVPPGMADRFGRVYDYEEGTDMQRDPLNRGDYKRVPGVVRSHIIITSSFLETDLCRNTTQTISRARASHPTLSRSSSKTTRGSVTAALR